jgi:beta-phosphoglucomutase-like phosphatase (HAD superfamily)
MLGAENEECALVGDTTADVFAGQLAGVPVIGYANKPGKAHQQGQYGRVQRRAPVSLGDRLSGTYRGRGGTSRQIGQLSRSLTRHF